MGLELEPFKVYPGRFYVLGVLALLAIQQNIAWMTFGTIPDESNEHFGLNDDDITLLAGRSNLCVARETTVLRIFFTKTRMVVLHACTLIRAERPPQ